MAKIRVVASSHFPQIKPAHHAFIDATGEGSNLDRALRDAVQNVFKSPHLKGRKTVNLLPAKITFNIIPQGEAGGDE
jgi:hypothetical protein